MRTPFMKQYHQQRMNEVEDEIYVIQRGKYPHKKLIIESLRVGFKIAEESLKRVEVIIASEHAVDFMLDWVGENDMPEEWCMPDCSKIGYWIEFESPFTDRVAPFDVKALHFSQVARNGLDILNLSIPAHIREKINEEQQEVTWILDAINSSGKGEFSIVCLPRLNRYAYSDDHICPFGVCTEWHQKKKKICDKCGELGPAFMIMTAAALAAKRGEFQDIEYRKRESTEEELLQSAERELFHSPQSQSEESKDAPDVIVSRIDIKKRTVYIAPDKEDETEARLHWKQTHSDEEIEAIKKAARKHVRRYKDGRVVDVKESRPRNYWRLKGERITKLT